MPPGHLLVRSLPIALALAAALLGPTPTPALAADPVSVYLELDQPSLAQSTLDAQTHPRLRLASPSPNPSPTGPRLRAALQARQASLEPHLDQLDARITGRFLNTVNALRIQVPPQHLPALATLPGVRRVQTARRFHPLRSSSVPWIGSPTLWSRTSPSPPHPLTGAGVRLGVIDSGIDYLHADFGGPGTPQAYATNNPTRLEPGTFPTAKVVGGWDFVGDRYDADDPFRSFPQPDPDPLDPTANGHGTHVAGIAAGFGVRTDGTTFRGPYDTFDPARFLLGPGVAPEASLYALKVFGATGSTEAVLDALDWATDPNSDGDLSDRLDVLVLSLGDRFGTDEPGNLEVEAVDRLARLGTVLAIAAGNDGDTHYILSHPGIAPRALTVANSIDGGVGDPALEILEPPDLAGLWIMAEGALTPPLHRVGPVTGNVALVEPADACDPLIAPETLSGRIALLDRGTCFFADKIRAVQEAGAIGVIVANNVDEPPLITMSANGDISDLVIPAVMVTREFGARIRDHAAREKIRVLLAHHLVLVRSDEADQLEPTTSRGPALGSHRLKPDLAAPGSRIASGRAGSGTEYAVYSGTSMAAPHLAGAAAILRQLHPDWPAEDLKAALINTAIPLRDLDGQPFPASRTGAGRAQIDAAATTPFIAKADTGLGDVHLSFGPIEFDQARSWRKAGRVVNHGTNEIQVTLSASTATATPGWSTEVDPSQLLLPPHGERTFDLILSVDPSAFPAPPAPATNSPGEFADFPRFTLTELEGTVRCDGAGLSLRLPWHALPRPSATHQVTATLVGAPSDPASALALATRGTSAHPTPVVTLLQLGALDTDHRFGDARSATDLIAVGAASDYRATGSIPSTTLYFGLATSGAWTIPQRAVNRFEIQIDLDLDGLTDFTVIHANAGSLAEGDPDFAEVSTDAFVSAVRDEQTGDIYPQWPLNMLDPGVRDTRPFGNGVLVLAAQASDLGLDDRHTAFRYRVDTGGEFRDRTAWIPFDAAQPVLDPTPHGIQATPLFDEGRPLQLDLLRTNLPTTVPPVILLLHHHHPPGRQVETVMLDLSNPDQDQDGLPDVWELDAFGDLGFTATDDPDGDGFDNATELRNRTAPDETRWVSDPSPDGTLRWISRAGRRFSVERSTRVDGDFRAIGRHLLSVDGLNQFHDPDPPSTAQPARFYRLRAE